MGEILRQAYDAFGRAIERLGEFLQSFDPTSWVAWLQVASLTLASLWTLYQFTRARRLNEGEVEDWIEEHLDDKPRNLMNERGEYLAHFNSSATRSFIARGLRVLRARAKILVLSIVRVVLVRKRKPSAAHAMLLFDAGKEPKAEAEFNTIAADFERMMKIYEKQVRAKRLEACNAYLYAGRASSDMGDLEATRRAYDNVLRLDDGDADAYKLIGKQYLDGGNIPAALAEYANIATRAEKIGNRAMEAEAYRLQATAHLRDNRTGRAHRMLTRSEKTELPTNPQGLAETQKMLGDLFAQQGRTAAALTAYTNSVTNYGQAGNRAAAAEVQEILDRMGSKDPWLTRMVEGIGQLMLRLATRLRGRRQRK
jgi:tetratricopeptide (TPR) repeat protein